MSTGKLGPHVWEIPKTAKETRGKEQSIRAANNQLVAENNSLREKVADLMEANETLVAENAELKGVDLPTQIRAALEQLDPQDNSAWTEAGLPKVESICQIVENNEITRADIEAAIPGFARPAPNPAG